MANSVNPHTPQNRTTAEPIAHWPAVWALALGVAGLTAAELLPVSLLSPMARDLSVSEGAAGQSVTAVAVVGFVTSLIIATIARRLDRRPLLLLLSLMQVLSSVIAALSSDLTVLLLGRALLGLSLGGFWALSASLALRLVPEPDIPRALSIIFGGVSVATIAAGPIGSLLGGLVGWRGVFWVVAAISALTLAAQAIVLPKMPPSGSARLGTLLHLAGRRNIQTGMAGVMLSFAGHFALFTYLRPFLERDAALGVEGVSTMLLLFGTGVFLGTWIAGRFLARDLRRTMMTITLGMGVIAVVLAATSGNLIVAAPAVMLWGAGFGFIPVGWSTWLTQAVPDEAESGGGLLVAAIQVAVSSGAALGGVIFNLHGSTGAFGLAAILMFAAGFAVVTGLPRFGASQPAAPDHP